MPRLPHPPSLRLLAEPTTSTFPSARLKVPKSRCFPRRDKVSRARARARSSIGNRRWQEGGEFWCSGCSISLSLSLRFRLPCTRGFLIPPFHFRNVFRFPIFTRGSGGKGKEGKEGSFNLAPVISERNNKRRNNNDLAYESRTIRCFHENTEHSLRFFAAKKKTSEA